MATVYKAFDTRLETDVAVKVIRTDNLAPNVLDRVRKRFDREAKALAKLTHPNIVKVTDYGEHQGVPYLVMPHLPGGTLKERIRRGRTPWREAVQLLAPIARALEYAHKQKIVHRDIKPSNMLVTETGAPMLSDFGVAKVLSDSDETHELTGTGMGVGTPEYMAPEQFQGQADARVDIYALGVVLYEMVTGRKPYIAETPAAVIIKQATEPLPRPNRFAPDLPASIEKILIKSLAKAPKDRYQNMGDFALALERLILVGEKENTKRENQQKKEALQRKKRQERESRKQKIQKEKEELQRKKREDRQIRKKEGQLKKEALLEKKREEKAQKQKQQEGRKQKERLEPKKQQKPVAQKTPGKKILTKTIAAGTLGILAVFGAIWLGFSGILGNFATNDDSSKGENASVEEDVVKIDATPEPTRIPFATPTPAYASGTILFQDDFEDEMDPGWSIEDGNWSIVEDEDGNQVLFVDNSDQEAFTPIRYISLKPSGEGDWKNYSISFRMKTLTTNYNQFNILVRDNPNEDNCNRARVAFIFTGSRVEFNIKGENELLCGGAIPSVSAGIQDLKWYQFRIDVYENELYVYKDASRITKITDLDTMPSTGYIKLGLSPISQAYIDDVEIVELASNSSSQVDMVVDNEYDIGSSWERPADGMIMMYIPEGEFEMGSNDGREDERPVHSVYLDAFWMDQTEVTNKKFEKCVQVGACSQPRGTFFGNSEYENHPVSYVNWNDAQSYCSWAGSRLPSEGEWEKAARGGLVGKKYPWGDEFDCTLTNADDETVLDWWTVPGGPYCDGYDRTAPVGSYQPNGYGLYNMAGNVTEWVADWYDNDYYFSSSQKNPTGPSSGERRVLRSGTWHGNDINGVSAHRSASRSKAEPPFSSTYIGFRCARDLTP